jgi:outer membrane protein assembly factor BamE (lipoprotein component of BamABCDE complex)
MKKALFAVLVFLCIAQFGCTKSIRYTEDEIKGYPTNIQEQIRKGTIDLGMTKDQTRYAWGSPNFITILAPFDGKSREEWLYTEQATMGVMGTKILFFYDGKLLYIK